MEYSQVISPEHRGLFIIAIDQSGSMLEPFYNHSTIVSKSEAASILASAIIEELVLHSRQAFRLSDPCPYCDICAIGYSKLEVKSLLPGNSLILPITALNPDNIPITRRTVEYIDNNNRLQLVTECYREWVNPQASNITPTADMLNTVSVIVSEWCNNERNKDSMPPIIFNISDGIGYLECHKEHLELADKIKSTGTKHGNTLLFNICVEPLRGSTPLNFPNPDDIPLRHHAYSFAQLSSPMPEIFHPLAARYNPDAQPPYLCFSYNSLALRILPMLDIVVNWKMPQFNY